MAPLGFLLVKLFGARYWVQAHGTDVWQDRRGLVQRLIRNADLVSTVSRETRRILLARVDLPPERVRVLPDTVQDFFIVGYFFGLLKEFKAGGGVRTVEDAGVYLGLADETRPCSRSTFFLEQEAAQGFGANTG